MRIKFNKSVALDVVTDYDKESDRVTSHEETFQASEEVDADIVNEDADTVDLQFPNGSVAFTVNRNLFETLLSG